MLRMVRNDVFIHRVVLLLTGFIVAEWAEALERECADLLRTGLPVTLDLSGVSLVGRSGIGVLKRAQAAGAELVGCSPLVAAMLETEGLKVERMEAWRVGGESHGNHGDN